MTDPIDWRSRILARLAGTQPRHEVAYSRIAGVTSQHDAQFREDFPAATVPAAVLVPIVERHPEPTILFTVRAAALRHHAGQISFPGGRIEDDDASPAAAALREAWEEIRLPPENSRVIGYLPDHLIFTGYRITPVVAMVREGFSLKFDSDEVADAFEVPLSHLFDPRNHRPLARNMRGRDVEVWEIPFGERSIWGATAGMLVNLYQLLSEEGIVS